MQSKSCFHNFYPDQNSEYANKDLQKGVFQDLDFMSCLRFANENKNSVQNLFCWSSDAVAYLNNRNPPGCRNLSDKKHRLLCHFFESMIQMFLSPLYNVSKNPGCESFSLAFDGGFDENMSARDVPEIDMETRDLLPATHNANCN